METTESQQGIVSQLKSEANVEKLKDETKSAITKIRGDADKMENDRRINEEQQRKERFD